MRGLPHTAENYKREHIEARFLQLLRPHFFADRIRRSKLEKRAQQTADQFEMKVVSFEKEVGYPVMYNGNRDRKNPDKRTDAATRTVARIARLLKGFGLDARARLDTNAIPKYPFAIECRLPSEQSLSGLTSQITRTLWPTGAKMTVLTVLLMYRTLTMLRTMLSENSTWTPLWQRAWEATRRRRIESETDGLAANVTRVLKPLGMDLGECARDEDEKGRKIHIIETEKAIGNTRFEKLHENGGSDRQQAGRQRKIWRRLSSRCPPDC